MTRKILYFRFALIAVVTALAALAAWPSGPDLKIGSYKRPLFIHQGLDLEGGVAITYEADLSKTPADKQDAALVSLKTLVESRVNSLGVSEPVIQTGKIGNSNTLLVELPGLVNIDEAIKRIGQFPDLKFYDDEGNIVVTGSDVDRASVTFGDATNSDPSNPTVAGGEPQVSLKFKDDGKQKFAEATTSAAGRSPQGRIRIELDGQTVSNPTVESAITDGNAIISGGFTVEAAKALTQQLNQGALPVPVKIIAQQTIGATLGKESLEKSVVAGFIGFMLLALFMILYYRIPGLVAILALIIYTLINIALYKLVPITLTLAGVAGFILSIGMALDANILIFERMREELRAGKQLAQALDDGYRRAWSSIRDSNFSTLITALILFIGTSGLIKGFALTLAVGVLVSMFSAIYITQVLLKLLVTSRFKRFIHV